MSRSLTRTRTNMELVMVSFFANPIPRSKVDALVIARQGGNPGAGALPARCGLRPDLPGLGHGKWAFVALRLAVSRKLGM